MSNRSTSITLPDKVQSPTFNPLKTRLLVYGSGGSGRSTFAAGFPTSLYFDLSGSAQYLPIRAFPADPPDDWQPASKTRRSGWSWFLEGIDQCLRQEDSVIVIDTIDRAFELCFQHVCALHGVESPEDNMRRLRMIYGQINREFKRLLSRLRLCRMGVILICNEETIARDRSGAVVDPASEEVSSRTIEPGFKAKSAAKHKLRVELEELCSVIGRAAQTQSGYVLQLRAPGCLGKDRTGLLGDSIGLSYEAFRAPFVAAAKRVEK